MGIFQRVRGIFQIVLQCANQFTCIRIRGTERQITILVSYTNGSVIRKPLFFFRIKIPFGINVSEIFCMKLLIKVFVFILDAVHRSIQRGQQVGPVFADSEIVIRRADFADRNSLIRVAVHIYCDKGIQIRTQ